MLCPNCQSEVRATVPVCPECGGELKKAVPRSGGNRTGRRGLRHAVAIAVAAVLLLASAVGGVLAVKALRESSAQPGDVRTTTPAEVEDVEATAAPAFVTPEDALTARLAEEGLADWVFGVSEQGDGFVVYVAGPPASEGASQYRVEKRADGWTVVQATALGFAAVEAGSSDEAEQVVLQYLTLIAQDKGIEARSLTIDPLRADSAGTPVSEGGLAEYSIVGSLGDPDGSYWIQTTQVWFGLAENWEYLVVPTDAGYRISDVQPW